MRAELGLLPLLLTLVAACTESESGSGGAAGSAGAAGSTSVDWVITLEGATASPMPPALLGQYDISGSLFAYDQRAELVSKLEGAGFSEWRVSVGRWEIATQLRPTLTDGGSCAAEMAALPPEASAPAGSSDLDLIAARDWFSDDGLPVTEPMTLDDARYQLGYVRSVIDVASAFGVRPFVSIDLMPRALSANRDPFRSTSVIPDACVASFTNRVSNVRPADPLVFAAAVAGLVERVVEGSGGEPGRPVTHWEIWNEPEFPYFWDKSFDQPELAKFFEMALLALVRLDAYRQSSPAAADLRFGLGSFATADVAATVIGSLDRTPLPNGSQTPLDFVSFHSYANDPLAIVGDIEKVADARAASTHYRKAELVLAEWGPTLDGVGWDPETMDVPLLVSTVIALGAPAGLARAHHSIFWDFYPGVPFGLVGHGMHEKPAYHAYALLAAVAGPERELLAPVGREDGRLDDGAVLASRDASGTRRVLFVNRGDAARTASIDDAVPARIVVFDDPSLAPAEVAAARVFTVPPRSLVLAELSEGP